LKLILEKKKNCYLIESILKILLPNKKKNYYNKKPSQQQNYKGFIKYRLRVFKIISKIFLKNKRIFYTKSIKGKDIAFILRALFAQKLFYNRLLINKKTYINIKIFVRENKLNIFEILQNIKNIKKNVKINKKTL